MTDMAGQGEVDKVKLLTLLNVNSAKRKAAASRDWHAIARLAKKIKTSADTRNGLETMEDAAGAEVAVGGTSTATEEADEEDEGVTPDALAYHLSASSLPDGLTSTTSLEWASATSSSKGLGQLQSVTLASPPLPTSTSRPLVYGARLLEAPAAKKRDEALLAVLGSYRDVLLHSSPAAVGLGGREHEGRTLSTALHALNHVLRCGAKIRRNNTALAAAAEKAKEARESGTKLPRDAQEDDRDIRDQGFTRPRVLILLPFRNSAMRWMQAFVDLFAPGADQKSVEGWERFKKEYQLPEGTVDKLATPGGEWPEDHKAVFKGNIDDDFRVGLKISGKHKMKLYSSFYASDVLVASPLGLRKVIEKESDHDFLSSIEILVADQLDVMLYQNWEHLLFVTSRLNTIPTSARETDFSRVLPQYLDNLAAFSRQTLLFSAFSTPQVLSLWNGLNNVAGRVRTRETYPGVLGRSRGGVKAVFSRFEVADPAEEDDIRFTFFSTKWLPSVLKSARRRERTMLVIGSYFDYLRVVRWFKKELLSKDVTFAAISEYSTTSEISRARTLFYNGQVNFLIITERFHFFRRYKLRGAQTVLFYSVPENPVYYTELARFPDVEEGEEDGLEVRVMVSRCDWLRLERTVGTEKASAIVATQEGAADGERRFTFV